MSLGSAALAVTLVVSAVFPQPEEPTAVQIATGLLTLLAGPFFLFGFAPPAFLRAQWRRREESALREVEVGLVRALSRDEIADAMLPHVVALVGGTGAALLDRDGDVLGSSGTPGSIYEPLRAIADGRPELYEPVRVGSAWLLRLDNGSLIVTTGPLTPFFATDELQALSATAVLVDLALGRARLFELERRSREAMQDFVAIASHDLRTPVSVVQGAAVMLGDHWDEIDEEEKRSFVSAIRRQIVLLDRLIGDLLTVSKLDVEELDVVPEAVDVLRLTKEAVDTVARDVSVEIVSDGQTFVLADPEHVTRMLQNYLTNALVYGAPPYQLEISGHSDWVTIRLTDQGPGVADDFAPMLFQKFARADKKKSKATEGTGLGLSIVRGLARANGGDAWYEPAPSGGACFVVRLPAGRGVSMEHAHG
jgi:signal transduction histidine kinase